MFIKKKNLLYLILNTIVNKLTSPLRGATREGVNMKDFILGGLLGFFIVVVVLTTYGFRIGVYTL